MVKSKCKLARVGPFFGSYVDAAAAAHNLRNRYYIFDEEMEVNFRKERKIFIVFKIDPHPGFANLPITIFNLVSVRLSGSTCFHKHVF